MELPLYIKQMLQTNFTLPQVPIYSNQTYGVPQSVHQYTFKADRFNEISYGNQTPKGGIEAKDIDRLDVYITYIYELKGFEETVWV